MSATQIVTDGPQSRIAAAKTRWSARTPGLLLALGIAALATVLGRLVPVIGGPVFGILLGMLVATAVPALRSNRYAPGYGFAGTAILQLSIVVLGTGLSLQQVLRVGSSSLPVMLGTLTVALGGAYVIGRLLRVDSDARLLIGVGTGICGASAIAAATAVTKPKEADVAYAIGTIFTFNIAAVLLFPPIGHLIGMSGQSFGLWSGTAINDTSSVVAAAYSFGGQAGPHAIVVKLTRSLMIIPIVLTLGYLRARRDRAADTGGATLKWTQLVPLFLIGFVCAAGLDTIGVIPVSWHPHLADLGTFLITVALAGIGLGLRFAQMRAAGPRPLLLGGMLWICVAVTSLGLQALTGTL